MSNHTCRYTCYDRVFWNIGGDNRACAYYGVSSDMNAWENGCISANICSVAYHDRLDAELRCDDRNIDRLTCVGRAEHLRPGPHPT